MPVVINGDTGITQSGEFDSDSTFGFKNRIINGGMVIDQRNAGASVSFNAPGGVFPVDRFQGGIQQGSGHTAQKVSTAPTGFSNSVLITVGTGASPAAGSISRLYQGIEGFNLADLGFGTANAQTITLSFWVRSSLTGTFAGSIYNGASNRTYIFTYAISAANTWEQKTITIAGDTTGTWATDNTAGMYVNWDLGTGSTYQGTAGSWYAGNGWATASSVKLAATSGATFYITGVQLEKGSTATSFDFRDYGRELIMCQRYYETAGFVGYNYFGGAGAGWNILTYPFKAEKRATPSIGFSGMTYATSNSITPQTVNTSMLNATVTATSAGGGAAFGTFAASAEI